MRNMQLLPVRRLMIVSVLVATLPVALAAADEPEHRTSVKIEPELEAAMRIPGRSDDSHRLP